MNVKTLLIIAAASLAAGISANAREAEITYADSTGTVRPLEAARKDSTETVRHLDAATVTARRELIKADADRLTYNVQADPLAEGGSLLDILRKVPMLSVN